MTLVPEDWKTRASLERIADEILREAHERLGKDGAVWDNEGRRVWSLNVREDQDAGEDVILGGTALTFDHVDDLMASLQGVTTLTRSELGVVQALAEGAPSPGQFEWTQTVAEMLGKTPNNIRTIWDRAKKKLIAEWANEPQEREVRRVKHAIAGTGFNLISGQAMDWGYPTVTDHEDASLALKMHEELEHLDSDWNYEQSLTDDGWQLGDDALWSEWSVPEES